MHLQVRRIWFTEISTIGKLFLDGNFFCYTLEDKVRADGMKVKGKTAIPSGTYEIVIDHSNRFQKQMPHILNVPMFEGIRIHSGNTSFDTEGCILLGENHSTDFVGDSRVAFSKFFPKLEEGLKTGKVFIDILNGDSNEKIA